MMTGASVPTNSGRSIIVRFITMREKQILASTIEIHKENWG